MERKKVRRGERSIEIEITAIEITSGDPNRSRQVNTERGPGNGKEDGEEGGEQRSRT